jgi:hypothetical protein
LVNETSVCLFLSLSGELDTTYALEY